MLAELVKLEPVHLRVLVRKAFDLTLVDPSGGMESVEPPEANSWMRIRVAARDLMEQFSPWIAENIIERLDNAGFLEPVDETRAPLVESVAAGHRQQFHAVQFQPTGLAVAALMLLFPNAAAGRHTHRLTGKKSIHPPEADPHEGPPTGSG